MKFVIQRVQSASVTVDEKIVGKIGERIPGSDRDCPDRYEGNRR